MDSKNSSTSKHPRCAARPVDPVVDPRVLFPKKKATITSYFKPVKPPPVPASAPAPAPAPAPVALKPWPPLKPSPGSTGAVVKLPDSPTNNQKTHNNNNNNNKKSRPDPIDLVSPNKKSQPDPIDLVSPNSNTTNKENHDTLVSLPNKKFIDLSSSPNKKLKLAPAGVDRSFQSHVEVLKNFAKSKSPTASIHFDIKWNQCSQDNQLRNIVIHKHATRSLEEFSVIPKNIKDYNFKVGGQTHCLRLEEFSMKYKRYGDLNESVNPHQIISLDRSLPYLFAAIQSDIAYHSGIRKQTFKVRADTTEAYSKTAAEARYVWEGSNLQYLNNLIEKMVDCYIEWTLNYVDNGRTTNHRDGRDNNRYAIIKFHHPEKQSHHSFSISGNGPAKIASFGNYPIMGSTMDKNTYNDGQDQHTKHQGGTGLTLIIGTLDKSKMTIEKLAKVMKVLADLNEKIGKVCGEMPIVDIIKILICEIKIVELVPWSIQHSVRCTANHQQCIDQLVKIYGNKLPRDFHGNERQRVLYYTGGSVIVTNWYITMRANKKNGTLNPDIEKRLDELGFTWDINGTLWQERFGELREFKAKHYHCNVPDSFAGNRKLAKWVTTQRSGIGMTTERHAMLDSIGFCWNRQDASWEERFGELREFKAKHYHCNVPQKFAGNPKLGRWVTKQRQMNTENNMSTERRSKLDSIGFEWNPCRGAPKRT